MFSGIVEAMGQVVKLEQKDEAVRFTISARPIVGRLSLGDSVCTSGVCLTVVDFDEETFSVEAIPETLRLTTCGDLREGDRVNLELALTLHQGLGGHLVFGHIDGVGERLPGPPEGYDAREAGPGEVIHWYSAPPAIMRYMVFKGSITISGVSLTVVDVADEAFSVALIPHTLEVTSLGDIEIGDGVNLEADMIAKYVAEQLEPYLQQLKGIG